MRFICLAFLAICLVPVSATSQSYSIKKAGVCFVMEIPDHMTKTFDLNEAATLQYQDKRIPAFMLVIEDFKDQLEASSMKFEGAKDFLEFFIKDFKKEVKDRRLDNQRVFTANGNVHAQSELYWTEDDMKFYMLVTAVETQEHFYKILCWTTEENKDRLKPEFIRSSASLKE